MKNRLTDLSLCLCETFAQEKSAAVGSTAQERWIKTNRKRQTVKDLRIPVLRRAAGLKHCESTRRRDLLIWTVFMRNLWARSEAVSIASRCRRDRERQTVSVKRSKIYEYGWEACVWSEETQVDEEQVLNDQVSCSCEAFLQEVMRCGLRQYAEEMENRSRECQLSQDIGTRVKCAGSSFGD